MSRKHFYHSLASQWRAPYNVHDCEFVMFAMISPRHWLTTNSKEVSAHRLAIRWPCFRTRGMRTRRRLWRDVSIWQHPTDTCSHMPSRLPSEQVSHLNINIDPMHTWKWQLKIKHQVQAGCTCITYLKSNKSINAYCQTGRMSFL